MLSASPMLSQDFKYSWKENYTVSTPARLSISSSDGNIEVIPTQKNEIEVYYIVTRRGSILDISKDELDEEVNVEVSTTSSSVEITVRTRYQNWFNWDDQMDVNFRVYAPAKTASDLQTSDGSVSLKGLNGSQRCKSSDGHINITHVTGNVLAQTSDGNIRVEELNGDLESKTSDGDIVLEDVRGNIESITSDGSIKVTGADGNITLRTSDGNIQFEAVSGSMQANSSDGNIRGQITQLKGELNARTSDGNIEIAVPGAIGLDLDVKGESLNVPLKNFSGSSEDEHIIGKINGGGLAVNLSSSDGNITMSFD